MKGLWKNELSGWNSKDTRRKSQNFNQYRRENAKAIFSNFASRKRRTSPKLFGRVQPYKVELDLDGWEITDFIYGKEVQGWEYCTFGLDGSGGSKHRRNARKDVKRVENHAVSQYISKGDWDVVLDYRGMRSTVSWDMC